MPSHADIAAWAPDASLLERLVKAPLASPAEYVQVLGQTEPLMAAVMLVGGMLLLLAGWRVFRLWVVLNALVVGALLGDALGGRLGQHDYRVLFALGGAVLTAALAWPLMRYAISMLGGLAGGALGYGIWRSVCAAAGRTDWLPYDWIGAVAGLVVLGVLAFFIFRFVIIVSTSLQGAVLVVTGILAIVIRFDWARLRLEELLIQSPHLLPFLISLPALIGLVCQFTAFRAKREVASSQ